MQSEKCHSLNIYNLYYRFFIFNNNQPYCSNNLNNFLFLWSKGLNFYIMSTANISGVSVNILLLFTFLSLPETLLYQSLLSIKVQALGFVYSNISNISVLLLWFLSLLKEVLSLTLSYLYDMVSNCLGVHTFSSMLVSYITLSSLSNNLPFQNKNGYINSLLSFAAKSKLTVFSWLKFPNIFFQPYSVFNNNMLLIKAVNFNSEEVINDLVFCVEQGLLLNLLYLFTSFNLLGGTIITEIVFSLSVLTSSPNFSILSFEAYQIVGTVNIPYLSSSFFSGYFYFLLVSCNLLNTIYIKIQSSSNNSLLASWGGMESGLIFTGSSGLLLPNGTGDGSFNSFTEKGFIFSSLNSNNTAKLNRSSSSITLLSNIFLNNIYDFSFPDWQLEFCEPLLFYDYGCVWLFSFFYSFSSTVNNYLPVFFSQNFSGRRNVNKYCYFRFLSAWFSFNNSVSVCYYSDFGAVGLIGVMFWLNLFSFNFNRVKVGIFNLFLTNNTAISIFSASLDFSLMHSLSFFFLVLIFKCSSKLLFCSFSNNNNFWGFNLMSYNPSIFFNSGFSIIPAYTESFVNLKGNANKGVFFNYLVVLVNSSDLVFYPLSVNRNLSHYVRLNLSIKSLFNSRFNLIFFN